MKIKRHIHIGTILGILILTTYIYSGTFFPLIFKFEVESIKYFVLLITFFVSFSSSKTKLSLYLIPLIIAAILSVLFNNIPSKFNASFRLVAWIMLIVAVGPFLKTQVSLKIKEYIFYTFPKFCLVITVLSFFYWFFSFQVYGKGFFTGLMRHAMLISPIGNIALVYCFIKFTLTDKKKQKIFYALLMAISLTVALLGASRSSLLGAFFALSIIFYASYRKLFNRILIFNLFMIPFYGAYFYYKVDVKKKMIYTTSDVNRNVLEGLNRKSTNNSREELWLDRINEFVSNPLFGSGFVSVDEDVIENKKYIREGGNVEFGSSYLALLSTLGIFGLIGFLYLLFGIWKLLKQNRFNINTKTKYLMAMYIAFFAVHLVFEGYIFGVGSFISLVLWAVIGFVIHIGVSSKATVKK